MTLCVRSSLIKQSFKLSLLCASFCALPLQGVQAQVMVGYSPLEMRQNAREEALYNQRLEAIDLAAQKKRDGQQNIAVKSDTQPVDEPSSYEPATKKVPSHYQPPKPTPVRSSDQRRPAASPVDFQADQINYDEDKNRVIATGDVFLTQNDRILRADRVSYDLDKDIVRAYGHVVLNDVSGEIHTADQLILKDEFKDGVVRHLSTLMEDGGRFSSKIGRRLADKTVMKHASYTACEPCSASEDKAPAWQIKASEVTHHSEDKRVSYKNARFEAYGVPVMYMPYFSHPDGTEDRKSGFLAPQASYKSNEGLTLDNQYYIDIAPDEDVTLGLMTFSDENPLAYAQWRKRWKDSALTLDIGATHTDYMTVDFYDNETRHDADWRAHVQADFLTNLNDKWRAGADINWASDDAYMDQYDISSSNILTTDLYAERFDRRDYAAVHMLSFQDTRVLEEPIDQPEIVPEIVMNFQGDPNGVPVIGGNWFVDNNYLGLRRSGDTQQDMDRFSLEAGWKRHFISDYGLVSNITLSGRQDIYHVRDRTSATARSGQSSDGTDVRFFPQAHFVSSYPLAKNAAHYQTKIEPLVSITAAPNIDVVDTIPNEDSQDVQLNVTSLFNANRFPGIDRVEDQSRVTYGLKSGLYFDNGDAIQTFIGQSYRLDKQNSPFLKGSGLDQRSSDVVGTLESTYGAHSLDYRFQLDGRHLSSNRHEIDGTLDFGRYSLSSRYLYSRALEGTDLDTNREQASLDASYYFTDNWRGTGGLVRDFGEDQGTRKAYLDLTHFGQCVSWGVRAERSYTDEINGDSDLEIGFRLGLKNIGEFEEPQWASSNHR